MHTHVTGLFDSRSSFQATLNAIRESHVVEDDQISLLVRDSEGVGRGTAMDVRETPDIRRTKADSGVGLGAFIGGGAGLLFGLSTVTMPWARLEFFGLPPVAQVLLTTAIGLVLGLIIGGMIGSREPQEGDELYVGGSQQGHDVLSVTATTEHAVNLITETMKKHGALAVQRDDSSIKEAVAKIKADMKSRGQPIEMMPTEDDMSTLLTPYTTIETPDEAKRRREKSGDASDTEWVA